MAYATQITISTGNKVSLNYQSQEVSVTLTYQLEREDTDVLAVAKEKTAELAQAHRAAWQILRDDKVSAASETTTGQADSEPAPKHQAELTPVETATALTVVPPHESSIKAAPTPNIPMETPTPMERIRPSQMAAILLLLAEAKWSEEKRRDYLHKTFSCGSVDELTVEQAKRWLLELQRSAREASQIAAQQRQFEKTHRNGTP